MSTRKIIIISSIAINILVAILASTFSIYYLWWLVVTLPILWSAIAHSIQKKHAILRNFPVLGLFRYFLNQSDRNCANIFGNQILMENPLIAVSVPLFINGQKMRGKR